jgi:hypothetical protein
MGGCETHSADPAPTREANPANPPPRQPTTSRLGSSPPPIIGHRLPASSSFVLARALTGATTAGAPA